MTVGKPDFTHEHQTQAGGSEDDSGKYVLKQPKKAEESGTKDPVGSGAISRQDRMAPTLWLLLPVHS